MTLSGECCRERSRGRGTIITPRFARLLSPLPAAETRVPPNGDHARTRTMMIPKTAAPKVYQTQFGIQAIPGSDAGGYRFGVGGIRHEAPGGFTG